MRFLLDEGIHPGVAEAAWELDLDVVSVHDLRSQGASDFDQLILAAQQERVLVTRNRTDYLHWTREFFRAGRPHAGVLFVDSGLPNDQPKMIARSLRRWAQAHSYAGEEESFGAYHVDVLPR